MISPRNVTFVPPGSTRNMSSSVNTFNDFQTTAERSMKRLPSLKQSMKITQNSLKNDTKEVQSQLSERFNKLIDSDVEYYKSIDSIMQK